MAQSPLPRIIMEKTPCFGTCPAYTISFFDDGRVLYKGTHHTDKIGEYETKISNEQRDSIYMAFKKAKIFKLKSVYKTLATDGPTINLTYNYKGRTKKIRDEGTSPKKLKALELMLIQVANKKEGWTKIN